MSPQIDPRVALSNTGLEVVDSNDATRKKRRRNDNIWRSLLRNRKARIGAILLLFFLVLAIIPGLIAPYSPSAQTFTPGLGPSAAHWPGPGSCAQGASPHLIGAARQSPIIPFAAGGIATLIAVLVGVASA